MKYILSNLYLFLLFISLNLYSSPSEIKFRHLDYSQGLSNNQVHSICKDHKGFLWIGTMSGLNRFDGYDFKVYKHEPENPESLSDNFVLKVLEDEENYLWVLSRNSNLCFYNPTKELFEVDRPLMKKNIPIPRNYISDISKDSKGRIWVTNDFFGIYIYNFTADSVTYLKKDPNKKTSISSNNICSVAEDSKGDFWVVNQQGIIEKLNGKSFKVEERVAVFENEIDKNENFRIFVDNDDDVWVYVESKGLGLKRYSTKLKSIKYYTNSSINYRINNNVIKSIVQDKNNLIYVGLDHGGINIINKAESSIHSLVNEKGNANSLPDNSITTLYCDNTDIIWVGTYKNGIAYHHPDYFKFTNYTNNPFQPKSLPYNDINCFAENDKGEIYIGTNGDGLITYNPNTNHFNDIQHKIPPSADSNTDVILSLLYDSNNRLWIGTYLNGLKMIDGNAINHYKHELNNSHSISNDRIWQIFEDSRNNIWVGTLGGGVDLWNSSTNNFKHYNVNINQSIGSDFIYSIEEDKEGNIWFGTIYGVYILNWKTQQFTKHLNIPNQAKTISNNKILVVKCDSRGWCWVGTSDGLNLYDNKTKTYRCFRRPEGLPDNTILSIEEDEQSNLWVSTPKGLSNIKINNVLDVWNFNFDIHNYNESDGLQYGSFNERASFKTKDGDLLFGHTNGFSSFHPQAIANLSIPKNLCLLKFELFNKLIEPGDEVNGREILNKTISELKELNLKHDENFFSISFTALDFFHPEKLMYQYRLDGFNNTWFDADPISRKATFTNLNHGTYKFKVRVSEDGKNWSKKEASLVINILPPLWATQWAIIFYILIFLITLLVLRKIVLGRERLLHHRENEKKELRRQEELNQLKIKFFTNISHEFRTPLTLILSPLKGIIKNTSNINQQNQLKLVERNANRLLSLVNQLLDFRKMEVNKLTINTSIGDIVYFFKDKTETFNYYSQEKNIALIFKSEIESLQCHFDHDKLEKVIFNLLSNAFKFTPEHGTISVEISINKTNQTKNLILQVKDSGIGIAEDKQNQIFERFFQNENGEVTQHSGSGIGLALTKEYVNLHKGTIEVNSTIGKGSCFLVSIPIVINQETINTKVESTTFSLPKISVEDKQQNSKPNILIVEDNDDLRFYLLENLKSKYNTLEASHGEQALSIVESTHIDLVVSDVMMPMVGGIELCSKLKQNSKYAHIPIILLTARTTNEQKLEGLKVGADDYITKPFSFEILEVKIQNIIKYRKSLQRKFVSSDPITPSEICVTSLDEKFLQKALDIMEENLSNSDFSIEKMGQLLGVSRAHLYTKLMAITGKTPADFIKIMRLKRATQLIEESQMTISEISYEVGYNGPRYFTKHFKGYYGVTPSKYLQSKNSSE
ncbi:hybrid sensor histidine kinase/response regulator transcription factor [Labilibacter marinus]|uniref:hybrid sensor histidine kinase/response regulator transcription factor n=1 Tax=Labilibacter marinus TaxID=1477105 RepID=UPI000830B460|nr:two-component regulator propeller domain-containing protein [Labilibacter marinus]